VAAPSALVGAGVATTILFGGIGVLGFLAKNHTISSLTDMMQMAGKSLCSLNSKMTSPSKVLSIN
jgi:hypothetical protein